MIKDFRIGEKIDGYFLLTDVQIRTSSNNKPYLTGKLSDITGSLDFQLWDYSGPMSSADNGEIADVSGEIREYKGVKQMTVYSIEIITDYSGVDLDKIIKQAPIDSDKAMSYLDEMIESITDEDYRKVTRIIFDAHKDRFRRIPAAKSVHHGFLSGLLMHTSYMVRVADFLARTYKDITDRSLLIAGTILHDFAKEYEFMFSELGIVSDYSVKGQLLGHLVMGSDEVDRVCRENDIPEEKCVLLQHMILSHHGDPEFGAAVKPMIAEAEMLSLIDMLDSRMEIYRENITDLKKGEFSKKIFALDRRIMKH
ncbi:MAG: HD domain-containing protein [Clostridia bacterium]|nr:HD domain-containing protein [Clostridia bacterium]